jgi:tetratricopeptide (TPR) repeat protein
LHHYDHVRSNAPDHVWALNNMGVAYRRLGLPIQAVAHYERARDAKNTLAMANLASDYMRAGFDASAERMLNEALEDESPHANVGSNLAELARLRE